jgi:hypothetical protein
MKSLVFRLKSDLGRSSEITHVHVASRITMVGFNFSFNANNIKTCADLLQRKSNHCTLCIPILAATEEAPNSRLNYSRLPILDVVLISLYVRGGTRCPFRRSSVDKEMKKKSPAVIGHQYTIHHIHDLDLWRSQADQPCM